ncbi:MAG: RNA polymerase factor sigma-54 [Thermogutta sp.]
MRMSLGHEFRQVQKQVQKQILSPRMIQSMEILQLPLHDLEQRVEQELIENPALEMAEPGDSEVDEDESMDMEDLTENNPDDAPVASDDDDSEAATSASVELEREFVVEESNSAEEFGRLVEMEREIPEIFEEENSRPSRDRIEEVAERHHDLMANIPDHTETLQDHLFNQLAWYDLDPETRAMAERIISNLDESGYLLTSLEDLLGPFATEADKERAEKALAVVQKMDPPGVGARDLRECLLLQLDPEGPYYKELKVLISDYLEDLEHNRIPQIAKKTKFSLETIHEAIQELRRLNPRPGTQFRNERNIAVTPDVFVEETEDGKFVARVVSGRIPRLQLNRTLLDNLNSGYLSKEEKEYIKTKIDRAKWILDGIQQRKRTLQRVAQAILDHQYRFLKEGPESIEPLKMQQIADKLGIHVTTVSRAVDDKWIQTPQGIFPLRRFFCGGTASVEGDEVAWDVVRLKVKELIDREDKTKPLSDEEIVKQLAKQGIQVKRRTVTKYREEMGIPSSRERRDWIAIERQKREKS